MLTIDISHTEKIHKVFYDIIEEEQMEKKTIEHNVKHRLLEKIVRDINVIKATILELIKDQADGYNIFIIELNTPYS